MPILVLPGTTGTQAPTYVPPTPPARPTRWSWVSPAGVTRDLTRGATYVQPGGIVGHLAPPRTLLASSPPTMDGGVYRGHRFEARDVGLGLLTSTRTTGEWETETRALVRDFDTTDDVGTLVAQSPAGATRMLSARYVTGLESPTEGDPGAVTIGTWAVQLRAYDPWWYGPAMSKSFSVATSTPFFPGPPFTLMPTELLGSGSSVTNPGDVEAFPVWTITGPATAVTASSGGRSWTVTRTLGAGETVTVDCDPRAPAFSKIVDGDGANLWGTATADYPDLWPLPAGESTITVDVAGGTSADTRITMAFNPRYRTS